MKIEPSVSKNSFIANNAIIIGNVVIGSESSVWFQSVIRGDVASIKIGSRTNIQDMSTLHVSRANHLLNKTSDASGLIIGDNVTIGHNCTIHGCTIGNNVLIGMSSTLLDNSIVEDYSMLAADSLLTSGRIVKSGELWGGKPAKFMRQLNQEELKYLEISANNYWELAKEYIMGTFVQYQK